MKLDPILVKEILVMAEGIEPFQYISSTSIRIDKYTASQISYHIDKLVKAGYLQAEYYDNIANIVDLTWEGHHFLATLRNDNFMKKAGEFLGRYGLPLLPEFLKYIFIQ